MSATGTRATDLLRRAGVAWSIHPYASPERHGAAREDRPSYAFDAAAALGLDPGTVFKTLVVLADGDPVLAIVPADRTLDLKRCAAAAGARRAVLAPVPEAERTTGYLVGGISPLGTRRRLRTFLDTSATGLERVYVSGGRRGLQVALRPADLATVTGAEVADLARADANP